jgi:hypothetical protein
MGFGDGPRFLLSFQLKETIFPVTTNRPRFLPLSNHILPLQLFHLPKKDSRGGTKGNSFCLPPKKLPYSPHAGSLSFVLKVRFCSRICVQMCFVRDLRVYMPAFVCVLVPVEFGGFSGTHRERETCEISQIEEDIHWEGNLKTKTEVSSCSCWSFEISEGGVNYSRIWRGKEQDSSWRQVRHGGHPC